MKLIERIKFTFAGRKMPVLRVSEVDPDTGRIMTLQDLGVCKDDPNTLVYSMDVKGWQKKEGVRPILRINDKGISEPCYVVSPRGETINLYTEPWKGPALENVIGIFATVDAIAIGMGLYPSMRDKLIFMVIGIFLGWLIIGPMINTMMS